MGNGLQDTAFQFLAKRTKKGNTKGEAVMTFDPVRGPLTDYELQQLPDGAYLSFEAVIQRLRDLAANIRAESSSGSQPEIAVIDVSSCADSDK